MAKKAKRGGVEHQSPGTKTYAVNDGHVLKSWMPPTTYCGKKVIGYTLFTPGYENAQWPGPIRCNMCLEGMGHGQH